jgi:hypothetical protein
MNNFKYNANINLSQSVVSQIGFDEKAGFDKNSTITQIVNLQPMLVSWMDQNGNEMKAMFNVDFYNEKVYTFFGEEPADSLLINAFKEIIKSKKRNIINTPTPESLIEDSIQIANQAFKGETDV